MNARTLPASLNHPFKTTGSIHAKTPIVDGDGCVLDVIDAVIAHLTEARKALNVDKPKFSIADGCIEDAWHEMKKIDTASWGDA